MLLVDANAGSSKIHGIGLIAHQVIPAGTKIWELTPGFDIEIREHQLGLLSPPALRQVMKYSYWNGSVYVLCGDDARFMNHSPNPNTSSATDCFTLCKIMPGEELTCNYGEFIPGWLGLH
jgi:SET domain-containing protein